MHGALRTFAQYDKFKALQRNSPQVKEKIFDEKMDLDDQERLELKITSTPSRIWLPMTPL
jgi:hypothetical protein